MRYDSYVNRIKKLRQIMIPVLAVILTVSVSVGGVLR